MSKKYKRTNTTITLSLNFNNEYEYGFTVDIGRRKITRDQARELMGKNCLQEKFELGGVGPALMDLLVQLGDATVPPDANHWRKVGKLAERLARPVAARCTDVSKYGVRGNGPSAEVSVPRAGEAAPDGQVIQVERLPKAK